MKNLANFALLAGALFSLPAAHAGTHGVFSQFQQDYVFTPTFSQLMACADIGCESRVKTGIRAEEANVIRALFGGVTNAAQERRAIALALGKFELFVGRQEAVYTWGDLARNTHVGRALQSRQTDCIAESHNATTYLLILAGQGLLRFHSVADIVNRGFLVNAHYAASVHERGTGAHFVVDTWFLANAFPAVVMPYAEWKSGKEAAYEREALGLR